MVDMVCDGGPALGYGHIRRALTLAAQLEADGVDVRLSGLTPIATALLPHAAPPSGDADIVVFDAPAGLDDPIQDARSKGRCVVTLDWFGDQVPDVNIAIYAHQEVRAWRQSHVGLDYVMVRREIISLRRGGAGRGVLVVMGGGDLLGVGHEVAARMARLGLEVTLVQGPLASDTSAGRGYRVLVNPPDLPQLYAACRWAVTNGGGCMFEAMCAGKASWAVPQTEAEVRVSSLVRAEGGLLGVGLDGLRDFSDADISAVAARGSALVDGKGAQRISEIIRSVH